MLVGVVTLSAALISTVACAMATVTRALSAHNAATVGSADLRLKPAGTTDTMPVELLARVRGWEGVARAEGFLRSSLALAADRSVLAPTPEGGWALSPRKFAAIAASTTISDDPGALLPPPRLASGRLPTADREIVIDAVLAERLGWRKDTTIGPTLIFDRAPAYRAPREVLIPDAPTLAQAEAFNAQQRPRVGETLSVVRQRFIGPAAQVAIPSFEPPIPVTIVGVMEQPILSSRPTAMMTLEGLSALTGESGVLTQIDIAVAPGVDPEALAERGRAELGPGLLLETTPKLTAGLDGNIKSSQLGFVLACVMAFLSASFIISTGLTTSATERQRELAILRCIGAGRATLASTQLWVGAIVGLAGAIVGVPLGIALASLIAGLLRESLPIELVYPSAGLALAFLGSIFAGVLGAMWPAWRAARTSPLRALASRASPPTARGIRRITLFGVGLVLLQAAIVGLPRDGQLIFWAYATVGLPALFIGYFLLGVPGVLMASRVLSGLLSRAMRLPAPMLRNTVGATPYRHGFTAGALMGGLALMVAIWTHGGAILRDWIGKIRFPDAFVTGLNLDENHEAALRALPFVEGTCAVAIHPVETDIFGVRALQRYSTNFMAFDPDALFGMLPLTWVQGDPEEARRRLAQGGAVLVAREFLIARGLGVGSVFTAVQDGVAHEFEIVGVVASPGLEIASKFFNVGDDYTNQSLHAVFGTRRDLIEKFNSRAIQLIQVDLADGVDDEEALSAMRGRLFGASVLDMGSGRALRAVIVDFAGGALLGFSAIAVVSMLVASFGVANLVAAGIDARQFEFGVLRAVGSPRGLLRRLVLAETLLIAITAGFFGTLMGLQGSWAGQRLDALLLGVQWRLLPPWGAIAAACAIAILLASGAAWPSVARLNRMRPRELLGAMRG